MKKKIAVTGGIGSGKSTVLRYLKELGYSVFSCDEIYREIIDEPNYIQKVAQTFPSCVVENKIDKKRLSQIIFQEEEKREKLNAIAHPIIMQRLNECMEKCATPLVFAEVPLLFEGNYQSCFDGVIVVMRREEQRIEALQKRDRADKEQIQKRMLAQFDYASKEAQIQFADCHAFLIENNGTEEELKNKIKKLIEKFS